jgi:phosphatidylglycerophosphatase A
MSPSRPARSGACSRFPLFLALPWLSTLGLATLATLVIATAVAIRVAAEADAQLDEHDSGRIVIDEVVGMLVALAGLPRSAWSIAVAFALFRVLDIVKLWPASWIDRRLGGGPGVVLDDVVSGIYANLAAHLVLS